MQGLLSVMNIAISLAAKSLAEPTPENIDDCLLGFRFIIEFSGKDDKVTLLTAKILDSEWIPIEEASNQFEKEALKMVENRNTEYRQTIEQETDISRDRQF